MTQLQDNERLRRLTMAYVDDGILDIFVGWIIFLAGLMLIVNMFWLAGVYVALFVPIMWSAKERITIPRLSKAEIRPLLSQKSFNSMTAAIVGLILLAVMGTLLMVVLLGGIQPSNLKKMILLLASGLIGAILLAGFVTAARSYQAPRWYGYGALLVIFSLGAYLLRVELPWLLMAVGAIIALTGTFYLARFIRNHAILSANERLFTIPDATLMPDYRLIEDLEA